MTQERKIYGYTSFLEAVNYNRQQSILCNNILEIDENILWTDDRFIDEPMSEEEFEVNEEEKAYYETYESYLDSFEQSRFEVYQWFITDLSQSDAEFKHRVFGLEFYYSEVLDCYIMPVYHLGTSWRILACPVYDEDLVKYNQDIIFENQGGYVNV